MRRSLPVALALIPLITMIGWAGLIGSGVSWESWEMGPWYVGVLLSVAVGIAGAVFSRGHRAAFLRWAALSPCICAPWGLLNIWMAEPYWFADSYATRGVASFLEWATKYPDTGPVNLEVTLGIGCVVGASVVPVLFAVYWLASSRRRWWMPLAFMGVALIPWLPLMSRLDGFSLLVGAGTFEPAILHGPVIRAVAILGMPAFSVRQLVRQARAPLDNA